MVSAPALSCGTNSPVPEPRRDSNMAARLASLSSWLTENRFVWCIKYTDDLLLFHVS